MIDFKYITIFPEVFQPYLGISIPKIAEEKKLASYEVIDLRDYTEDSHKTVDDKPYGGGSGMLMKVEPFDKAVEATRSDKSYVIVPDAAGNPLTQSKVRDLSQKEEIIFLCPRYEGVDQRVIDNIADEAISIGDYVLSGGELPALVISDAIIRTIPGVIGNEESLLEESFSDKLQQNLEYPHYTRPEEYKGWKVPEVLLSGNHEAIAKWRKNNIKQKLNN